MAESRDPEFPEPADASAGSGSGPGPGSGPGSGSGSGSSSGSGSGSDPSSGSRRAEKAYQLSSMGLSVDSCLSAGELCEEEEQQISAMSDSVYSTVSDVTLVGECCDVGQGTGEEVSSSTDSGTSVRECANSKESATLESPPRDELVCDEGAEHVPVRESEEVGRSGIGKEEEAQDTSGSASEDRKTKFPAVTVSVDSAQSAVGAMESGESAPSASSDNRETSSVTVTASGDATLQIPEPDRARRHSLDSAGILAAVFRQNEQFQELNDVEDERPRSFSISTGARRSQSRRTSASESQSDAVGGAEGGSPPGYDLEEALYRFHHQSNDSYASSEPSDVSVQELELETTGDFPHDFQFPEAGGSSRRPSGVWPEEAEAEERRARWSGSADRLRVHPQLSRTLSDQPRGAAEAAATEAGSLPVPVVVVESAEEPAAVTTAAVPPVSRSPPVRRGILARLVDSTAAFLLGGMQDDGVDRRHRSYTVTASDYRPAAAAAAAAARRAAAAVSVDQISAPGGDPGPSPTRSTLALPQSPVLGQVESPAAPCRQCLEPTCTPEVACQPPLARRRSMHSSDRPATQDT